MRTVEVLAAHSGVKVAAGKGAGFYCWKKKLMRERENLTVVALVVGEKMS
jgi:hypothetical protein